MVISRDARSGGPRVPLPVPAPRGTKELVPIAAMPCTEADWDLQGPGGRVRVLMTVKLPRKGLR